MAKKKLNPKYHPKTSKICRTRGLNLWGQPNNAILRKNYRPGQHGMMPSKPSDYGVQLNAKQRIKAYYGRVTEKQLKNTYKEAVRMRGDAVDNLVGLLERRLDAIVYRAGFAKTIFSAGQMISHGHVKVNGRKVDIRSYLVKPNDIIEVKDSFKDNVNLIETMKLRESEGNSADYIEINYNEYSCKFIRVPAFNEVPYPVKFEPHLVIEYYSR